MGRGQGWAFLMNLRLLTYSKGWTILMTVKNVHLWFWTWYGGCILGSARDRSNQARMSAKIGVVIIILTRLYATMTITDDNIKSILR